ncbi:MAG: flagellar basal body rod protein FlgB [Granulosicoccus sp.]|nr:flagellar basal body rod protein FlgB [Granulosicoccus sp.]
MPSIDNHIAVHANAVHLRSTRARLISGNLANADTPGYRARDIDFSASLSRAVSNTARMRPVTTHAGHIPLKGGRILPLPEYRDAPEGSLDENTVNSEFERIKFADNEVRYRASVQFVTGKLNGLLRALRGE